MISFRPKTLLLTLLLIWLTVLEMLLNVLVLLTIFSMPRISFLISLRPKILLVKRTVWFSMRRISFLISLRPKTLLLTLLLIWLTVLEMLLNVLVLLTIFSMPRISFLISLRPKILLVKRTV